MTLAASFASAQQAPAGAPDFTVPLMDKAPTIDGAINPAEWRCAAGFDGLTTDKGLEARRAQVWIGATGERLHIAVRSQLPDEGELLAEETRRGGFVYNDDSVEIVVVPNPQAERYSAYQIMINARGVISTQGYRFDPGRERVDWQPDLAASAALHDGGWHVELSIPIAALPSAANRPATEGLWRINVARNFRRPTSTPSLDGLAPYVANGHLFRFTDDPAPGVHVTMRDDPIAGPSAATATLFNPSAEAMNLEVALTVGGPGGEPASAIRRAVRIDAGGTERVNLSIPKTETGEAATLRVAVSGGPGPAYYNRAVRWTATNERFVWRATGPPPLPDDPQEPFFGTRIGRTMTLLETATPARRNKVHILLYGQSIVGQGHINRMLERELGRRYPHADIEIENRAIGGFQAPNLVRTAVHDLYPVYPDLVLFHVYGGEDGGELERIVHNIRKYTTAELLMWTHHIDNYGPETDALRERGSALRRHLALKYGAELVEVRGAWQQYLDAHGLQRADLLRDKIHLNDAGGELLARLVLRHFRLNRQGATPWAGAIRSYSALRALEEAGDEIELIGEGWRRMGAGVVGESKDGRLRLEFVGNRVDLIAQRADGPLGTAQILVDGKAPAEHARAYAATRPSRAPGIWFPAIRRVTLGENLIAEDWTLTVRDISADGKEFAYSLTGSETGFDGQGHSGAPFRSNSGRILIDPADFYFEQTVRVNKRPLESPITVTWSVFLMGTSVYAPQPPDGEGTIARTTLIQGIANTKHTLEIVPNGDGPVPIETIVVHRPGLEP